MTDDLNQPLIDAFRERYGAAPTHVAIGPGRVNLIGEHTDYNDGFVLPIALRRDVRIALRRRSDRRLRLLSLEYDNVAEIDLDAPAHSERILWSNYVSGVAWALGEKLAERGQRLQGFDGVVSGNVPRASGLSSSAALEVAAALALLTAAGVGDALSGVEIAQVAQRAENDFVGVKSGIMDQFISTLGQADHALLIDCRSLDYELMPFPSEATVVIGNTKASRSLAGSAYNERRAQCEEGVRLLRAALPQITALRDLSSAELETHKALLPALIYRRCRHVVQENERVLETVRALQAGDLVRVGTLMNESHESLRHDYEVSSDALDLMVDAMRGAGGVYGARLTGAGFGGCAIALVPLGQEQAVADAIFEQYPKETNIWPEVYTTGAADGARVETL